jgi:hypothetical protein
VLVLLSAVPRSVLSNVIAYEAYDEEVNIQVKRLRLLKDHAVDTNVSGAAERLFPILSATTLKLSDFPENTIVELARSMAAMLIELSSRNAASELTRSTYLGINIRSQSLDDLTVDVNRLLDLPTYRLSVDCFPDLPTSLTVSQPLSVVDTQISLSFDLTAESNNTVFEANYPGVSQISQGAQTIATASRSSLSLMAHSKST